MRHAFRSWLSFLVLDGIESDNSCHSSSNMWKATCNATSLVGYALIVVSQALTARRLGFA